MIDKRPDIESERPDFERNALSRGLSVDRNDTGSYLMAVSEYRWRGWKERARIAAEREREMQRQYDAEKQSRVKYQELAYATMNAIDSFLGLNVRRGEGTTVDSFKANLQRMLDEIKRILFDWANAEVESADVGLLLKQAHAAVCSLQCPSVWPTNEPRPHCDLCRRITAALGTREDGE